MPFYKCKTPIKIMVNIETKESKIAPEGEVISLTEAEAEDLLTSGAIDGPVADPKKK